MSREIYNEKIKKAGMALPGRDDETTDTSRGYVGWGPGEDATCGERTVEHPDWPSAHAALQNPAREIHDFYFNVNTPSRKCDCCAGSGRSKDYAELAEGFYRFGGGRWAGWGNGRLHQDEVDALVEHGRLGRNAVKGQVTPANVGQYLGPMGHDAINRWILTPIRAAHLGIDCNDCYDCVGTGLIDTAPTRISLYMWTVDPMSGTTRVDTAEDVRLDEIDEIREYLKEVGWEGTKRRFGWPSGDNMHPNIRYDENFIRDPSRPFGRKGWWDSSIRFRTFEAFVSEGMLGNDPDLNLVFDYRIITDEAHFEENVFASSELPETFSLQVIMTHPRKGADRTLLVENCTAEDGEDIKNWLRKSYEVHGRHFAWAAGREFGNEKREDAGPEEDVPYDAMKFFTGR